MDAQTCLEKLKYVGVLAFATVDQEGAPQIRNISAIHYRSGSMYFFTARARISAGNCSRTVVCRFWATPSSRR